MLDEFLWVRRAVMLAVVLLVLHAVAGWAYSAFGVAAAIVSALLPRANARRPVNIS